MSEPSAHTFTAFRYMERFRCIGAACEATCCEGWQITIDREHHELLKQAMRRTAAERQEFDDKIELVKRPTRSKAKHSLVVMSDRGACSFFTPERLCSLQKRYGEQVLGNTCAQYPRLVSQSGARLELTGTASCPEAARLLLLHADALELDEVPAELLSRRAVRQQLPDHPAAPYVRYHDELRNLVLDVLSDARFDLSTRLAQVASFADRTRPFLHHGVATLEEARLGDEVDRMLDPEQRVRLADMLPAPAATASPALRVPLGFLVRPAAPIQFNRLRAAVLRAYLPSHAGDVVADEDLGGVEPEILRGYRERKLRFARLAPRIDQSLTNFAKHYWVHSWYFTAPDLLSHHMELLIMLAAIRLLTLGNPILDDFETASSTDQGLLLDHALVAAVFLFSRSFEHATKRTAQMRDDLHAKQLVTLNHALHLAWL